MYSSVSLFPKSCFNSIAGALLVLLSWVLATQAAEMNFVYDEIYDCRLEVSGVIKAGDAARFSKMISSPRMRDGLNDPSLSVSSRVCLNSPGGSFNEAFKIVRELYGKNVGTVVPRDAICESACAIVFMAGSKNPEDDRGVVADRILHPLGKLGFHAPSLEVGEGNYGSAVVGKAYNLAVAGIGELVGVSGYLKFPSTLVEMMLTTPPQEMSYVNTVGQAARWQIAVAPSVEPNKLTPLGVINACNNWYQFMTDTISTNGFFESDKSRIVAMWNPVITNGSNGWEGKLEGFEQEGASVCKVSLNSYRDEHLSSSGWVSIGDDFTELYRSMLFSRDTPIASLARSQDRVIEKVVLQSRSAPWKETSQGECFVFSGTILTQNHKCTRITLRAVEENFATRSASQYVANQSGNIVASFVEIDDLVDEGQNHEIRMDGIPIARKSSDFEKDVETSICSAATYPDGKQCDFQCWGNRAGRNFCFVDYASYNQGIEKWVPPGSKLSSSSEAKLRKKVEQETQEASKISSEYVPFAGYDLYGGDLSDGFIRNVGAGECKSQCQARRSCDAFTYDRWNSLCFLKSIIYSSQNLSIQSKADTYVSSGALSNVGKLPEPSIDALTITRKEKAFRDAPSYSVRTSDPQECASESRRRKALAFNWHQSSGRCEVFTQPGEYFDHRGVVAGYFQQLQ